MKQIMKLLSFVGLVLTGIPSFFVFSKMITLETNALLMLAGTILWFFTAPLWMKGADDI